MTPKQQRIKCAYDQVIGSMQNLARVLLEEAFDNFAAAAVIDSKYLRKLSDEVYASMRYYGQRRDRNLLRAEVATLQLGTGE